MSLILVEGGGVKTLPILEKVLKLRKMGMILALVAAVYYGRLVLDAQNMEVTRISEHSLMPGVVATKFDEAGLVAQVYQRLATSGNRDVQEVICEIFGEWGLPCYQQRFGEKSMKGKNTYAFVRSTRADGSEAQMIVTKVEKGSQNSLHMVAQIMAFAKYASRQVYWARDIVFIFVDGEDEVKSAVGMDAFMRKYFEMDADAEELREQIGVVIAGIVYELSDHPIRNERIVTAKLNGINGQQVNLDLFNSMAKILYQKHLARCALYGIATDFNGAQLIPLRALYTQAFVAVEGLHSVMGRYGVQAMTIGVPREFRGAETGKFIESMTRMLNNALERLHQSYFMYILGDDLHFASIAFYMPLIGILIAPLLLNAYYEWRLVETFNIRLFILAIHLIGLFEFQLMNWCFVHLANEINGVVRLTMIAFGLTQIPFGMIVALWEKCSLNDVRSMRIVVQLETALVLGCLALINFGLALAAGFLAMPVVFMAVLESKNRFQGIVKPILMMLMNPMVITAYMAQIVPQMIEWPGFSNASFLETIDGMLARMLMENNLFGSTHFGLLLIVATPIWNCLFLTRYFDDEMVV